jgi:GTPase SAR1 family protein
MNPSFRVAIVGPSRVGKTTLITAILNETDSLLAGAPVSVSLDETTEKRVRDQQRDLRRAIEVGEFNAAALAGNQTITRYKIALQAGGDTAAQIPFDILDFPGTWLDPGYRSEHSKEAVARWPEYLEHVRSSIMLLVPIDAAVLMEAATPRQKAAGNELLGLLDVESVGREWARYRNVNAGEPAVIVLAPLKCEKYFGDNGGLGHDEARLRARVKERYEELLQIVAKETSDRVSPVRVVYAPIDTYGCVELMEATWVTEGRHGLPEFTAHYRFRGSPPRIRVRAAGTVMQELCRSVLAGQEKADTAAQQERQSDYDTNLARKQESKGFWGTIDYHLSGEAGQVKDGLRRSAAEIAVLEKRRAQLTEAAQKLAAVAYDARVEIWGGEDQL